MTTPTPRRRHQTKVRRRHGLCVASCTCGWSEDTVSKFSAWMAVQRHHESTGGRSAHLRVPARSPSPSPSHAPSRRGAPPPPPPGRWTDELRRWAR